MTVREGFDRIYETYNLEDDLDRILEQFKERCQDSPLTNQQEDSYIELYKVLIGEIKTIHSDVVDSYLAWITEARES